MNVSKKSINDQQPKVFNACPHCGHELSPWEKVLLSVDRALTCKHCWYRIIIEITQRDQTSPDNQKSQRKG
jgi:DNA-directed RNA polymerase subunit RPC12/RpoP